MVFFNADATSEIYTCSLHDALPILEPVEAQLTKMRGERSTLTGADKQAALAKELALEKQLYQQLARMVPAPDSTVNPSRDRKSTRLNSSHVAISSAVFCLKKKKTKT